MHFDRVLTERKLIHGVLTRELRGACSKKLSYQGLENLVFRPYFPFNSFTSLHVQYTCINSSRLRALRKSRHQTSNMSNRLLTRLVLTTRVESNRVADFSDPIPYPWYILREVSRHQSSGDSSRYLLYTTRLCAGILNNLPVLYTKTWINDESLVTTLFAPKIYREMCTCKQGASREELTVHI